jgi:NAD/NADP transhydrogenase alpha subunit
MTPDGVRELERHGIEVLVETGAGEGASISDADYRAAGADIVPTAADACSPSWRGKRTATTTAPRSCARRGSAAGRAAGRS